MRYKNRLIYITLGFVVVLCSLGLFMAYLSQSPTKIIMSYYVPEEASLTSYNNIKGYQQLRDKIDHLNVIAYAFLHVNQDGKVVVNGNDTSGSSRHVESSALNPSSRTPDYFAFFLSLNNPDNNLKKVFSIGGADDHQSFLYAIQHVDDFVTSVSDMIDDYQFVGVDLDFEINRSYTLQEAELYAELIAKLRKKLGPEKLISIATMINQETLQSMGAENWKIIANNANFISMMCYDLISPFNKPAYTEFASNLYLVQNSPKFLYNAALSCDQSIHYLTTIGVPAEKMVLGIPAFAISYGGVGSESRGLFQPSVPDQTPIFDDMGQGLLRYSTVVKLHTAGFKAYTSMSNGYVNGVWLYHPEKQQFITFDNIESVHDKIDYVLNNKLAGVMLWRIGQDVPIDNKQSLLNAISAGLHDTKRTTCGYPSRAR